MVAALKHPGGVSIPAVRSQQSASTDMNGAALERFFVGGVARRAYTWGVGASSPARGIGPCGPEGASGFHGASGVIAAGQVNDEILASLYTAVRLAQPVRG